MAEALVIPAPPQPVVAVAGGGAFPVRRILCVGRNYADHAREMGGDPTREPPFFFAKPPDAVVSNGATIPYPLRTRDLHHEIELVVALSGSGVSVSKDDALALVYGYAVGIDLTRRDLQAALRKEGRPWTMAKGFDAAAPTGAIRPAASAGHLAHARIWLSVNGALRQQADLADMIWSVPEIIAELSGYLALAPGDLIFTGTPAGVGALVPGDRVEGGIDGLETLAIQIGPGPANA